MRIQENHRTVSFTIFDADKLDPVTVFLQDFGGGSGRLIVECWCTAWAAYWGAMGSASVREFVLDAHPEYIATRMLPQDRKHLKKDEAYLLRIVKVVQRVLQDGAGLPLTAPDPTNPPTTASAPADGPDNSPGCKQPLIRARRSGKGS